MGKKCFNECQKCVLISINIILILIGLAILGVTTFSYMESEIQATFNGAEIIYEAHILMYVLICIGSVTVIVAILGCSGAYHESTWMIGTYCTCVAVIICVEVAMGVLGILYQQETETSLTRALKGFIDEWFKEAADPDSEARKIVYRDNFQSSFECCGGKGRADYGDSPLPMSCCPSAMTICDATAYSVGCYEKAAEVTQYAFRGLTGAILAVASYETVGLLLSVLFYLTVVRHNSGRRYVAVPQNCTT